MNVSSAQAREVVVFLEELGIRVVIVGGIAIQVQGGRATGDVDLLVAAREYPKLKTRLAGQSRIHSFKDSDQVSGFYFELAGRDVEIRVDILNPSAFSGGHSGDELFDFVWKECSSQTELGRVANPEFVWYTRLLVNRELYRDKIAEDIEGHSPQEWLDRAVGIATRFGTEALARKRALEVLQILGQFGGSTTD